MMNVAMERRKLSCSRRRRKVQNGLAFENAETHTYSKGYFPKNSTTGIFLAHTRRGIMSL